MQLKQSVVVYLLHVLINNKMHNVINIVDVRFSFFRV